MKDNEPTKLLLSARSANTSQITLLQRGLSNFKNKKYDLSLEKMFTPFFHGYRIYYDGKDKTVMKYINPIEYVNLEIKLPIKIISVMPNHTFDLYTEDHPIRPNIQYAEEKAEVEQMCERFAERNESAIATTLRLCTVIGPHIRNPIVVFARAFQRKIAFHVNDFIPTIQLVHKEDAARAFYEAVIEDHPGLYNLAPDDVTDLEFIGRNQLRVMRFPLKGVKLALDTSRRLKLHYWQPSFLNYLIYRWTASSERIRSKWGFEFKCTTEGSLKDAAKSVKARDIFTIMRRYAYLPM